MEIYIITNSSFKEKKMKFLSVLVLTSLGLSLNLLAQECEGHLIDNSGRVVEVERMSDLKRAINFVFEDCYVISNVSGWANQLYVHGQFSGNYDNHQEMELRRAIRDLQSSGRWKDAETLTIQFSPSLIDEAIDYSLSRNCYVLPEFLAGTTSCISEISSEGILIKTPKFKNSKKCWWN